MLFIEVRISFAPSFIFLAPYCITVSVSLHEISLWLVLASLAACLPPHLYLFPDLCYPMTKKTGVKNGESVRYGEESQES